MHTKKTEVLPIQGIRSVIYTGRTNRYLYRGGVQLCIQERLNRYPYTGEERTVTYTEEGVPLSIQGKITSKP